MSEIDHKKVLLDDIILAVKGHYGPGNQGRVTALRIFQQWTGTKNSNYYDLLSVILPTALELKHFKVMSSDAMSRFILSLLRGHWFYGMLEEETMERATEMLMSELTMIHRDNWLDGRDVPEKNPVVV